MRIFLLTFILLFVGCRASVEIKSEPSTEPCCPPNVECTENGCLIAADNPYNILGYTEDGIEIRGPLKTIHLEQ